MKRSKNLWKKSIVDQSSDRSQVEFYKIASTYPESTKKFFMQVINEKFEKTADTDSIEKTATNNMYAWQEEMKFPVDTAQNTIISKVYLVGQKNKFPVDVFTKIAERIDTFLDLYDIPDALFAKASNFTKEAKEEFYLLPKFSMCKIASVDDLDQANKAFESQYLNLSLPDRVEFANNFLKAAEELSYTNRYSPIIIKYAALMDSDIENTKYMLSLRAAAVNREGKSGEEYTKLINGLNKLGEDAEVTRNDLIKLANTIYGIDKKYNLTDRKYDKKLPCAYSVVFNKQASEDDGGLKGKKKDTKFDYDTDLKKFIDKISKMSKSDIVGKYGEGALALLDQENGVEKLASVIKKLGMEI